MYLALTYDHRLLDGKDAVLFLKRIQTLVENPKRMLFEIWLMLSRLFHQKYISIQIRSIHLFDQDFVSNHRPVSLIPSFFTQTLDVLIRTLFAFLILVSAAWNIDLAKNNSSYLGLMFYELHSKKLAYCCYSNNFWEYFLLEKNSYYCEG
jgi:hypothetical protein